MTSLPSVESDRHNVGSDSERGRLGMKERLLGDTVGAGGAALEPTGAAGGEDDDDDSEESLLTFSSAGSGICGAVLEEVTDEEEVGDGGISGKTLADPNFRGTM